MGNKVDSSRAVQFRKWANGVIEEFTIKGFAMDEFKMYLKQRRRYMQYNGFALDGTFVSRAFQLSAELLVKNNRWDVLNIMAVKYIIGQEENLSVYRCQKK